MAKFPSPYISTTNIDDPIMIRVPLNTTSIGSANIAHPKGGVNSENMSLKHVGGSKGRGE